MIYRSIQKRAVLVACASGLAMIATAAAAQTQPTTGQQDEPVADADIVVTAQRRSESIQSVPIAISAFNEESLGKQRIEGGSELVRAVPNVSFAKGFYSGFNFQIRGVGTQLGAASADAGVGIHLNNVPLTASRFFEAEFFDTERVEVLRGPQGTLYGRNATGGVVNVVTVKPTDRFEGSLSAEVGTYDSYKVKGMLNLPILDDRLALRVAGSYLQRSGFGVNTTTGNRINDRKLWSTRATLVARPIEGMEATLLWQHFHENDNRARTGGLICVKDAGPASVGGVAVTNPGIRAYLSQGCADASIYSSNRNGTPYSQGTLFGAISQAFGGTTGDYYAGKTVSLNLQDTDSLQDPTYRATDDLIQFHLGMQIAPALKVTTITSYTKDNLSTTRDFIGAVPVTGFNVGTYTPGGIFNDPQLGPLDRVSAIDYYSTSSKQFTQEVRIDSSFDGFFNFSLGAFYLHYRLASDYYALSNAFTYAATVLNGGRPCAFGATTCIYIDPGQVPDSSGHNNFLSSSPYQLESQAVFGEAYFNLTHKLKLTIGGRYTDDAKRQINLPVRLLTAGSGQAVGAQPDIRVRFREPTGRVALDWKPDLAFTNQTLFYAVASRGYKAGGPNPPPSFAAQPPYNPEFVNAIEVGTKNTLLNGRATLNISGFHYDYKDYQVSETRDRTQQVQNIDARVQGLEFEATLEPVRHFTLNGTVGLLDSKITKGAFVNPTNFTGGDPTLTLVKGGGSGAVCAVNTAGLATYLATNPSATTFYNSVCPGLVPGLVPNRDGIKTSLIGNDLPNAPHWTLSAGAQYSVDFSRGWQATLRGDYYRQGKAFARTYNTVGDQLRGWDNLNATLTIENVDNGWQAQLFVKNVLNNQPVLNTFLADTVVGLVRFGFTSDPRIIGASVSKRF